MAILLCGILVVTVGCYLPGLHGDWLFDDAINIQNNPYLRISHLDLHSLWQAAMSGSAGLLHRPLSMATFALNAYFTGLDPYYFKATNLAIHLLNGICVFILTRLLFDLYRRRHRPALDDKSARWISLAVATLWLLHPLNLAGVLYVVQRMASLSALFTFSGLILYLYGRKRQIENQPGGLAAILTAVLLFTPLAALSKENGLLLPAFMLAIEAMILQWQTPDQRSRRILIALFSCTVLLPVLLALAYALLYPTFITNGYLARDFSLAERLMTEARVLWFYLRLILLPDISAMGIYHDDMAISRGLLSPATTLVSMAGLAAMLATALVLRKKQPLIAFGVFFFLIGHSMESSVLALELAHEHRNYLPSFGILLPAVYYVLTPMCRPDSLRLRRIAFGLAIVFCAMLTTLRATYWRSPLELMQNEVMHHPQSVRANADLALNYAYAPATNTKEAEENYRNALFFYSQAAYLSDTSTAGIFGILAINTERGLATDSSWINELKRRLEQAPFSAISINSLMALEKCLAAGRCTHSPELMESLLRSALHNPTLTGPSRSLVLFALSDFLFRTKHQTDLAVETAYQAMAAAPNDMTRRLTLIVFLLNMSKLDKTGTEISKARTLDTQGTYTPALAKLEQQLAVIRAQTDH